MDFSVYIGELPGATDLSTRWRTIARLRCIPMNTCHSGSISESLSFGDIEILTHIEDHYAKLWNGNTKHDAGSDELQDGVTKGSAKGPMGDTEELVDSDGYLNRDDMIHQSVPWMENLNTNYTEHQARLPRSWMEDIAIFTH